MLVVQKYGGSSLAGVELVQAVAKKIQATVAEGHRVVVVVSAMGDTTDDLVADAERIGGDPALREMDAYLATGEMQSAALMAMALEQLGIRARSFSGGQAGIFTDGFYGRARIRRIDPAGIRRALDAGVTPVVAGFQGVGPDGDITTLGRGGSDLTAIALAGALAADRCEIYSDVAGVFTADPRIVTDAAPLRGLGYDEMLELASQGAQVLQTQGVEYARNAAIPVVAKSTFSSAPGTVIGNEETADNRPAVTAVALKRHIAKVGLREVPDAPGVAALIFGRLAARGINVELVFQSLSHDQLNDIAFTIEEKDVAHAAPIVQECLRELGGREMLIDANVAKVSTIGSGMVGRPGVAAAVFRALAEAGINIQMIGTSEITISCIVSRDDADRAVNRLHQAFQLGASRLVEN